REILRQPKLLEVRDVPHVPDDRTHQRIVLSVEILVIQPTHKQQCALARLRQETSDLLLRWGGRLGGAGCDAGFHHGRKSAKMPISAMILPFPKLASRAGFPTLYVGGAPGSGCSIPTGSYGAEDEPRNEMGSAGAAGTGRAPRDCGHSRLCAQLPADQQGLH